MLHPLDVFRRLEGEGWLILLGGEPVIGDPFPELVERLLGIVDLAQFAVGLTASKYDHAELTTFLEDLESLFGEDIPLLVLEEDPLAPLQEAGLAVLSGGRVDSWLQSLAEDTVLQELQDVLRRGGVILAGGDVAGALGSWALPNEGEDLVEGLDWLPGGLVLPGLQDPASLEPVRGLLRGRSQAYALGLVQDSALAIGPQGSVEVWGRSAPKLVLGKGWAES